MDIAHVNSKILQWHHDKNLIDGATDWTQSEKLLEEFIELIASQYHDREPDKIAQVVISMVEDLLFKGRIKKVLRKDKDEAKLDAIGDMTVVLINLAERNKSSLETCMCIAWDEIKDRQGKMINGSFVKESDL